MELSKLKRIGPVGHQQQGFTLIEIMMTLVIGSIIMVTVFKSFDTQQQSYVAQEQVIEVQQSLRNVLFLLSQDIKKAGFDPSENGLFGFVTNFPTPNDLEGATTSTNTSTTASIAFTVNADRDQVIDDDDSETIAYRINNSNLQRLNTPIAFPGGDPRNWETVAENIQALSYAYAYDIDDDGNLEIDAAGNTIWAQDTDGDNNWDSLDSDLDGDIDLNDNPLGSATGHAVSLADIRVVKFWILTRSKGIRRSFNDTTQYKVGSQIIQPNDNYQRRLHRGTVYCRNNT